MRKPCQIENALVSSGFVHHDVFSGSMRIGEIKAPAVGTTKRSGPRTGVSGFSDFMDVDEPSAPSQTSAPAGVAGIGALVALQQVEDATTGRSRGLKRAEAMLGELDEMHKALIFGGLPTARLQAMANQMKQRLECGNDSHLHSIMADIELRLAVELAKRGISVPLSTQQHDAYC